MTQLELLTAVRLPVCVGVLLGYKLQLESLIRHRQQPPCLQSSLQAPQGTKLGLTMLYSSDSVGVGVLRLSWCRSLRLHAGREGRLLSAPRIRQSEGVEAPPVVRLFKSGVLQSRIAGLRRVARGLHCILQEHFDSSGILLQHF